MCFHLPNGNRLIPGLETLRLKDKKEQLDIRGTRELVHVTALSNSQNMLMHLLARLCFCVFPCLSVGYLLISTSYLYSPPIAG